MGERPAPVCHNAYGKGGYREPPRISLAVGGLDETIVPVGPVIEGRYDFVKRQDDLGGGLLNGIDGGDENEIIPPDVADETRLGLLTLDDVENEPPRYAYDLVPAGKAVMVVEGLEIIEIGIGQGKDIAGFDACLDAPAYGYVAGKLRQGIDVDHPFGPQHGEGNAGHPLGLDVGPFQVVIDKERVRCGDVGAAVHNEQNGELVENGVALEIVENLHRAGVVFRRIENDQVRRGVINVIDRGPDTAKDEHAVPARQGPVEHLGKHDIPGYDDDGLARAHSARSSVMPRASSASLNISASDSCCALVTLPNHNINDIRRLINFILFDSIKISIVRIPS